MTSKLGPKLGIGWRTGLVLVSVGMLMSAGCQSGFRVAGEGEPFVSYERLAEELKGMEEPVAVLYARFPQAFCWKRFHKRERPRGTGKGWVARRDEGEYPSWIFD